MIRLWWWPLIPVLVVLIVVPALALITSWFENRPNGKRNFIILFSVLLVVLVAIRIARVR